MSSSRLRWIPTVAVGCLALAMTVGGGVALWHPRAEPAQFELEISAPAAWPETPQVYWLDLEGDRLRLVPQAAEVRPDATAVEVVEAALNQLLEGPEGEAAPLTSIPPGTRLLSLTVAAEGIHVDLSAEFGRGGGSASIVHRVAQAIYTATSVDPDTFVFLSVDGHPIDRDRPLGGEGLILNQPTTRQEFADAFSLHVSERRS